MFDLTKELKRQYSEVINPFKLTKGLPLDVRYIVSDVEKINDEIPLVHRYKGLLFYAFAQEKFYYFGNNLNVPLTLTWEIISKIISSVTTLNDLYSNADKINDGQIVFIKQLNANYQKVGNNFVYHSGAFRTDRDTYNQLRPEMKTIGMEVHLSDEDKDYRVEVENGSFVLVETKQNWDDFPEQKPNYKIYKIQGRYYIVYNGEFITLGDAQKAELHNIQNTENGEIEITHNLNTTNLSVEFNKNNEQLEIEYRIVDENKIAYKSWKTINQVQIIYKIK